MEHKNFAIICLHVLQGCPERFRKVLKENEYYFFNDWYRLEKGKLVRNNGNVYTRNFFGDNISIQAIVGKNGCGKSSLFELIYRILNNFSYVAVGDSYRATAMPLYFIRDIRAELYYELDDTLCCITCKDDEVFLKRGEQEGLHLHFPYSKNYQIERYLDEVDPFRYEQTETNNSNIQKKIVEETLTPFFYSLAINYSIQSLNPCDYESERSFGDGEDDECYDSWLMSLYNKNDGYMVPLGFEPYRGGNTINLRNQKELTEDRMAALLIDSRNKNKNLPLDSSERFSVIPNYELDTITFVPDYALLHRKTYDDDDITEHLLDFIDDPSDSRLQLFWSAFDLQYCGDEIEDGDLYKLAFVYLIRKTFQICEHYPAYYEFAGLKEQFFEDSEDSTLDKDEVERLIKRIMQDGSHIAIKIKQTVNFINSLPNLDTEFLKSLSIGGFSYDEYIENCFGKGKSFHSLTDIIEHFPPSFFKHLIFVTDQTDDKKTVEFSTLSSGERQYAYSVSSYLYHLSNIISVHSENDRVQYHNACLFLDEIEMCYHPEYQRLYISNLVNSLKRYRINESLNLCVVLSTHSPFLLSDIPQSNVLMLKKGKIKKDKDGINAFGANVNDLLAHKFFLENGFIGQFAQQKILDLVDQIEFHNENDGIDVEYIEWLTGSIGDPIIKEQLMMMFLDKKFGESKKKKKQWLQELIDKI